MNYYLILHEYVGPNQTDGHGNYYHADGEMLISTTPGKTNMSHEVRLNGWLGTSNDWASYAYGVYATHADAISAAAALGYTHASDPDMEAYGGDETVLDVYLTAQDGGDHWDAEDWLQDADLNITAETTDIQLLAIVEQMDADATAEGVTLHHTSRHLTNLRDNLRDTEWVD